MSEEDPEHVEGVDFSDVNPVLDEIEYPVSAEEVVERYGDRELERTNADPISIADLFDSMGENTFESEDGLRTMILSLMPSDSEGRTNYSDRGGSTPTRTDEAEEAGEQTSADVEEGSATDPDSSEQ